jgi:hypothetical protein
MSISKPREIVRDVGVSGYAKNVLFLPSKMINLILKENETVASLEGKGCLKT